jgi:hypothetical protein
VPVRLANLALYQQKHSRHPLDIACRQARPMPLQPSLQHPHDAFRIDVLPPACSRQPEFFVQLPFGIRDARNIVEPVRRKESRGLRVISGKMDKRELRALRFNLCSNRL